MMIRPSAVRTVNRMVDGSERRTGVLATAAVIAGVTAVTLVVAGFWLRDWMLAGDGDRFNPRWWLGLLSHIGGYLALGKVGFKVALAVVLGVSGAAVLLRERRRQRGAATTNPAEPEAEEAR